MKLKFPVIFHCNKKSIGTASAASMGFYAFAGKPPLACGRLSPCGLSSLRRQFFGKYLSGIFSNAENEKVRRY